MKKITFLMLHLNYGGIEKQVTTLANELAKNKEEYSIEIVSVYKILEKPFYELDPNITIKYLLPYGPNKAEIKEALKSKNIVKAFKQLLKGIRILHLKHKLMKQAIKKLDTDVIISSRIEFSRLIKRKDTLNISQEHSYIDTPKYLSKIKKSFKYIKYLIVMTNTAKEKYELWLKDEKVKPEILCIPNMIERIGKDFTADLENSEIISIGRLHEVKDFTTLIDVFNNISKYEEDWKLTIVGEGEDRNNIENKINEYSLGGRVTLTGKLSEYEILEKLKKSSIFVLTSKSESFSLVICEAMRQGLPCVSFNIDVGPKEIIEDGENGFLIDGRNKKEMAEKIKSLINDKNMRAKFGKNARESVNRFYSDEIVKEWEKLFI